MASRNLSQESPDSCDGAIGGIRRRRKANIESYQPDATDRTSSKHPETEPTGTFPRLSIPLELMRHSYDHIIIGSGYGSGVAASRMARTGDSVCVLERGDERWPGEYPTYAKEVSEQLHCSGKSEHFPAVVKDHDSKANGFYHNISLGSTLNCLVCNGLGGTSLINGNIYLEADRSTLSASAWPSEIKNDPQCLEKYYSKARDMLSPTTYPFKEFPELSKTELFREQAEKIGLRDKYKIAEQTTMFRTGRNSSGVEYSTSSLNSQDFTGNNDGSKQTVLSTYISDAWNWGAEIFTQCEVRRIQERSPESGGGYIVFFAWHGQHRSSGDMYRDLLWVHAKKAVFIGAGVFGTTEILLRSQRHGLALSNRVGQHVSDNGEVWGLGVHPNREVNALGQPGRVRGQDPPGPTCVDIIDNRNLNSVSEGKSAHQGWIMLEASFPLASASLIRKFMLMSWRKFMQDSSIFADRSDSIRTLTKVKLSEDIPRITQVLAVMSRHDNTFHIDLKDGTLAAQYVGQEDPEYLKHNKLLASAANSVGGTILIPASQSNDERFIFHPTGGVCMASDGTGSTGAANHAGQLFKGHNRETHEGLIVVDGAVTPTALGISPMATITALAERSVHHYTMKHGLEINEQRTRVLNVFSSPQRRRKMTDVDPDERVHAIEASFQRSKLRGSRAFAFTESLTGFLHKVDQNQDHSDHSFSTCHEGYNKGKILNEAARMFLTTRAFDIRALDHISSKDTAVLTGTLSQPCLKGSPFMIRRGAPKWSRVESRPASMQLIYNCELRGISGESLNLYAEKIIDLTGALPEGKFWLVKTPLLVTISDSSPQTQHDAVTVAQGVMYADLSASIPGLASETAMYGKVLRETLKEAASKLMRVVPRLFSLPSTPLQYALPRSQISEMLPLSGHEILAADGVVTRMYTWEPSDVTPDKEAKDIIMIAGLAVDHRIFALGCIDMNAVGYFTRAGYRVHILIPRCSSRRASRDTGNMTSYEARLDIAECLRFIREIRAREFPDVPIPKVYILAHCLGSMALASGLLDGTIPAEWVSGITASQVFMNPVLSYPTRSAFFSTRLVRGLYKSLFGNWFSLRASSHDSPGQLLVSHILRAVQLWDEKELCNNATCHRVTFTLGRLWNHRNLDQVTHRNIDEVVVDSVTDINVHQLDFMARMGRDGQVKTDGPLFENLATRDRIARLKGIPIMLLAGADNKLFSLDSVNKSYSVLCDTFGPDMYKLNIVPGYGHHDFWIGCKAWRDIYPLVREEVDRVVRGSDYHFQEPNDH